MARRKEKAKVNPASRQPVESSLTPGQDISRRVLLGCVTALVVARPLVPTEDPGLRAAMPDPSGLALNWLWLVAFLGWTIWRFWTKPSGARFGLIDVALLAVVALNLLAIRSARYQYVAWLGTWEWVVFFLAFYMVRRLAAWPGTSHGLLAALLASATMLSGYAAYQRFVEIPEQSKKSRAELQADMAAEGFAHATDDYYWEELEQRARSPNVFATFAHPNSFAGFLGLLLPVALVYTIAARRTGGWDAMTLFLIFCTALIAAALWWTHSRGALLATLFVAAAVIVWAARRSLTLREFQIVAGLGGLALALAVIGYIGMQKETVGKAAPGVSASIRLGYWTATWKMIRAQPWLGVGPGNFGRHYPAYMAPSDYEDIQNPHNFVLEMWANCGIFAMLALVFVFILCLRRAWVYLRSVPPVPDFTLGHEEAIQSVPRRWSGSSLSVPETQIGQGQGQGNTGRTPWEFYLGGMSGLILGFILTFSASELIFPASASASDRFFMFIYRYHAALLRSLIWFPAFALFLAVRLSDVARSAALIAGLAVMLLNLCVSDGITLPAVALPMWIAIALVLAAADAKRATQGEAKAGQFGFLLRILPIPVAGVLLLIYGGTYWEPTAQGARMVRAELRATEELAEAINPPPGEQLISDNRAREIRSNRVAFIRSHILRPIQLAAAANPDDMRYVRMQADWQRVIWQLSRGGQGRDTIQTEALSMVEKAITNDPMNRENWLAKAELERVFAESFQLESFNPTLAVSWPWGPFFTLQLPTQPLGALVRIFNEPSKTRAAQAAQAAWSERADALAQAIKLGPTQLRIRYELAMAYAASGQIKKARDQARESLRLQRDVHPSRKLPVRQREQFQQLLDAKPSR
jgi:O-antigen ligase